MAILTNQLHFVLFPFMAQGHMIPMVDIAKLLAKRGVIITIITTPVNAARFKSTLARAQDSGLPIRIVQLQLPCEESGLPKGCENVDLLPADNSAFVKFFTATSMLKEAVENLFDELRPRPICIISDMCLPYTSEIASKFDIPRISFHGTGSLFLLCLHLVKIQHDFLESISSDSEYFVLPGLPDKIEFTKLQLPFVLNTNPLTEFFDKVREADLASFGVVINSFQELEPWYFEEYKKTKGGNAWCIGPVSLCNENDLDKAQRGNDKSINDHECLKWLDSQEPQSVIYVCLGSLCNLSPEQLIELGLGLEASKRPFLWAIRGNDKLQVFENWIKENGFEERIKGSGMGFLIRGFAPQVLILSHASIGGFVTHCGWNSTLEGLTAGLPLITWPLFGDQFCNEKLVVHIVKTGVSIGAERPTSWNDDEANPVVIIKSEQVKKAIDILMGEGEEGEARRERAKEIGKMAKRAVEEGGSCYLNTTMLIEDVTKEAQRRKSIEI